MKLENPIHLETIIVNAVLENKNLQDELADKVGKAMLRVDFVPLIDECLKEVIGEVFIDFEFTDELKANIQKRLNSILDSSLKK